MSIDKFFSKVKMKQKTVAPISEIFHSIQGEIKGIGLPMIFIRFYGCNLRCRFNGTSCDTHYAVEGNEYKMYDVKEIIQQIKTFDCYQILFTGGEPMLYQKFIWEIVSKLNNKYMYYIETNGTLPLQYDFYRYNIEFNISIKLKNSNQLNEEYDKKRYNKKILDNYIKNTKCVLKFVFTKEEDMKEINEIMDNYKKIPFYLMPEGENRESIIENSIKTIEICKKYNVAFSPRLHILLWDKKKKV
jgi:7-carboxy-7-deazaguanine synthase